MPKALDDARLKLTRANEHLDEFATKVNTFLEGKPYEWVQELNPQDSQEMILRWRVHDAPDPYLGVIAGDIIQNCRSAIDYVASPLNRAAGGRGRPVFPLYDTKCSRPLIRT